MLEILKNIMGKTFIKILMNQSLKFKKIVNQIINMKILLIMIIMNTSDFLKKWLMMMKIIVN